MPKLRDVMKLLTIFSLILGAVHFYLFARICYYLQLEPTYTHLLGWTVVLVTIWVVISLPLSFLENRRLAALISWTAYPWMGVTLLLFTAFLTTDLLWITLKGLGLFSHFDPSLTLQKIFGLVTLSLVGGTCLFALWNAMRPVYVKPMTLYLEKLPPALDGLRLVQITDLHVGPMLGGRWLRRVVDRVNTLGADIVAVTGDLVDGTVETLRPHVAPLSDLKATHGRFFVTGNHEYYSGADAWCAHIQSLGITTLRNQRVCLTIDGHDLEIAGVDDWSSAHFPGKGHNLPAALAGRNPANPVILLAHQPLAMHEAMELGVDLQLSGHTHGGQIWPFSYLVYLQQPVVEGLFTYKDKGFQLYVSPGTGFWGPPMRLGTRAEITCITLRSKAKPT